MVGLKPRPVRNFSTPPLKIYSPKGVAASAQGDLFLTGPVLPNGFYAVFIGLSFLPATKLETLEVESICLNSSRLWLRDMASSKEMR